MLTDVEVSIVEEAQREVWIRRVVSSPSPYAIRGKIVLDPGYTADCEILRRNISPMCTCAANVRVFVVPIDQEIRPVGSVRLRLLKSDVRVSAAMMRHIRSAI